MKKKLLILTALLTFAISAMTVSAKAPGKTNVTYQVDPSYEVVIPSDATVPFLTEKTAYGTIEIKEAVLEENKCILVKMDASGTLVNEKHPKSKIPYQILNGKKGVQKPEIHEGRRKNGSDHFNQKCRLEQGKRRKL